MSSSRARVFIISLSLHHVFISLSLHHVFIKSQTAALLQLRLSYLNLHSDAERDRAGQSESERDNTGHSPMTTLKGIWGEEEAAEGTPNTASIFSFLRFYTLFSYFDPSLRNIPPASRPSHRRLTIKCQGEANCLKKDDFPPPLLDAADVHLSLCASSTCTCLHPITSPLQTPSYRLSAHLYISVKPSPSLYLTCCVLDCSSGILSVTVSPPEAPENDEYNFSLIHHHKVQTPTTATHARTHARSTHAPRTHHARTHARTHTRTHTQSKIPSKQPRGTIGEIKRGERRCWVCPGTN
ncbi:hypothetical protein F7725_023687 [Dissostichus mawsoni]|uniref:Uncharacterized protein n=1 Tax=Dissostichus mawsoni TaxID=36200 RepID=A0A7J5XX92_DISMA|nr:hypothetical protein F7725_023687 [Dissostichus mawsoni]